MNTLPGPVVAAARSPSHDPSTLGRTFRDLLDNMSPPLPTLIKAGDKVLIKAFFHHGKHGNPHNRLVSHPEFVAALIEAVKDCGAAITLGDEGSLKTHTGQVAPDKQWIHDLARKTGAELVSFAQSGASQIRGRLHFPRNYLIARALLEADAVVSCANLQPHKILGMSGAVKNMFNAVIGKRQQHLQDLFPNPWDLGRIVVDVCAGVKPCVSFLDLTTVRDPNGRDIQHPVGLVLAGCDPVAVDAVAAHAIGWDIQDLPTLVWGQRLGLGCKDVSRIPLAGLSWSSLTAHRPPPLARLPTGTDTLFDKISRRINYSVLPPKPVIDQTICTGCGECVALCPTRAIRPADNGSLKINGLKCVNCHFCVAACEDSAISLRFTGAARVIRQMMRKPLTHP